MPFVAFSLLAASGPASPQASKPAPAEERPASSLVVPRLNLKLDNPAQYSQEREGGSADALPSLGGDARPLPAKGETPTSARPFPKDTERGER